MTEPANIAELRRYIEPYLMSDTSILVSASTIDALLDRSERLERAVELLREIGPLHPWLTQRVAALLAEHDAAKEAT